MKRYLPDFDGLLLILVLVALAVVLRILHVSWMNIMLISGVIVGVVAIPFGLYVAYNFLKRKYEQWRNPMDCGITVQVPYDRFFDIELGLSTMLFVFKSDFPPSALGKRFTISSTKNGQPVNVFARSRRIYVGEGFLKSGQAIVEFDLL